MQFLPNHLYRINHSEVAYGMNDQLTNATLFSIGIDCCGKVKKKLEKDCFEDDMPEEKHKCIVIKPPITHYKMAYCTS